jgi:GTP-binding protein
MAPLGGPSPREAYEVVRRELALYDPALLAKPEIVVATKMDLTDADKNLERFRAETGLDAVPISAVAGQGLPALIARIAERLFGSEET